MEMPAQERQCDTLAPLLTENCHQGRPKNAAEEVMAKNVMIREIGLEVVEQAEAIQVG
jgi:hypothetical protein